MRERNPEENLRRAVKYRMRAKTIASYMEHLAKDAERDEEDSMVIDFLNKEAKKKREGFIQSDQRLAELQRGSE